MKKILLSSAIFIGAASSAFGQSADPIDDILVCQQIADEAARLACFDAAAVRLSTERDNGLVGIYREDIEAVERDAFGFDLPSMPTISLSMFRGDSNSPDPLDPANTPERMASNDTAPAPRTAPVQQPAETTVAANTVEPVQPEAEDEERRSLISRIPGLGGRREQEAPATPASRSADTQAINGVQVVERNDEGGVERIVMDIERIREIAYGRYRFYMTNGQRWVMSGTERFNFNEDADNFAEIRRAAWGSYFMQINGEGRAIRVRRER